MSSHFETDKEGADYRIDSVDSGSGDGEGGSAVEFLESRDREQVH